LRSFVADADQPVLTRLLDTAERGSCRGEVTLRVDGGVALPVRLGLSPLRLGPETVTAMVVSDETLERQLTAGLEKRVLDRTVDINESRLAALNLLDDAVAARDRLTLTNAALRASEARFRRYFESTLIGIAITSPTKGWVEVNDRLCEMLGYSREELLRMTWSELTDPVDLAADLAQFEHMLAGDIEGYQMEKRFVRKDGRSVPAELSVGCVRLATGRVDYVVALIQDISRRREAEMAMAQITKDLESKNMELERFLYSASHDLKSPLVTVRTFLGYVEQDLAAADTERLAKDMGFIRAATDKMVQLLDDLLEISRAGRLIDIPVTVTFRQLAGDALVSVAGRISERGVTTVVAERDVTLYGDRNRLAEILQNLVDNACKFIGDQKAPHIEIGVEMREAETVFFVRDNGIGIPARYHEKIFDLFERLDTATEGTGIGLALIRRIVEFYEGRIWVESPGPGQGACFYFTLPGALVKPTKGEAL
jgi:PAS domain S-box-containing protein